MSLYTFATENFTTSDDIARRPAMSRWQLLRTLAFIVVIFLAWFVIGQRNLADASGVDQKAVAAKAAPAEPELAQGTGAEASITDGK